MKYILLILSLFMLSEISAQKKFNQTDIADLALIYHGGTHRSAYNWTKEQFEPYVSYTNKNNKQKWLFDGFLFLEFKDGKGRNYAPGYDKLNARKQEWSWLIDRHFEKDIAFNALNDVIAEKKKTIKDNSIKHKVVMGLPSPIFDQKDWGALNNKNLDFAVKEDRLTAIKWYIDEFLLRFKSEKLKNLQMSGFYWVDEDSRNGKDIEKDIAKYVQSKGLKFYWIPYWRAAGSTNWKNMGFDFAWQQPNHFFNDKIPDSRLQDACDTANKYQMGLEMEFDDDALVNAPKNRRGRLIAYIDYYKKNGAFSESSIAYYQGGNAFYKLFKSKEPLDQEAYYILADLIAERKEKAVYKKLIKK